MPAPVLIDWFEKGCFFCVGAWSEWCRFKWGDSFAQYDGEVPEWPKGTDCKSVGSAFGGSNPPLPILSFEVG